VLQQVNRISPLSVAEFTRIVAAWQLWRTCCAVLPRALAPRLTPKLA
jgi:hypothetical protein